MFDALGPDAFLKRRPWTRDMGVPLMERVRFGNVYAPPWVDKTRLLLLADSFLAGIRAKLDKAELIEASGVCEYFYAGTDQEEWSIERDFPKLVPPFPVFWIEMKRPSRIVSRVNGTLPSDGLPERMGFLFERLELAQGKELLEQIRAPLSKEVEERLARREKLYGKSICEKKEKYGAAAWLHFIPAERRFALLARYYNQELKISEVLQNLPTIGCGCRIDLFIQVDDRAVGPMGFWVLLIGPDGSPLIRSQIVPAFMTARAAPDTHTVTALNNLLNPALLSVYDILYRMAEGLARTYTNQN
jgi:hypothetical protein